VIYINQSLSESSLIELNAVFLRLLDAERMKEKLSLLESEIMQLKFELRQLKRVGNE